jgi:hypothetical protein
MNTNKAVIAALSRTSLRNAVTQGPAAGRRCAPTGSGFEGPIEVSDAAMFKNEWRQQSMTMGDHCTHA